MKEGKPILCPECGWTGQQSELDREDEDHHCPVCAEVVEIVE